MKIRPIKPELNRSILTDDRDLPILFGALVRPSTTSPARLKVSIITPVDGQAACVAEFRLELN